MSAGLGAAGVPHERHKRGLEYLQRHHIESVLRELTAMLVLHQPDDPFAFLIDGLTTFAQQRAIHGDGPFHAPLHTSAVVPATPPLRSVSARAMTPLVRLDSPAPDFASRSPTIRPYSRASGASTADFTWDERAAAAQKRLRSCSTGPLPPIRAISALGGASTPVAPSRSTQMHPSAAGERGADLAGSADYAGGRSTRDNLSGRYGNYRTNDDASAAAADDDEDDDGDGGGIALYYVDTRKNIVLSSEDGAQRRRAARLGGRQSTFLTADAAEDADGDENRPPRGDEAPDAHGDESPAPLVHVVPQRDAPTAGQYACLLAVDSELRLFQDARDVEVAAGLASQAAAPHRIARWTADGFAPAVVLETDQLALLCVAPHDIGCERALALAARATSQLLHALTQPGVRADLRLEEVRVTFSAPANAAAAAMAALTGAPAADSHASALLAGLREHALVADELARARKAVADERGQREAHRSALRAAELAERNRQRAELAAVFADRAALRQATVDKRKADAELTALRRVHEHRLSEVVHEAKKQLQRLRMTEEEKARADAAVAERTAKLEATAKLVSEKDSALARARDVEAALKQALADERVQREAALAAERRERDRLAAELAQASARVASSEADKSSAVASVDAQRRAAEAARDAHAANVERLRNEVEHLQTRLNASAREHATLLQSLNAAEQRRAEQEAAREELLSMSSVCGLAVSSAPKRDCVLVSTLTPEGPAALAGLVIGDAILRVGEIVTTDKADFLHVLHAAFPGETEDFVVRRNGEEVIIPVQFGAKDYSLAEVQRLRALAGEEWCANRDSDVEGVSELTKKAVDKIVASPARGRARAR